MGEEKQLTTTNNEKEVRKNRVRLRWFIILIVVDVFLAGYLVFEMISIFTKNAGHQTSVFFIRYYFGSLDLCYQVSVLDRFD